MRHRSNWIDLSECLVCGKQPYVDLFPPNSGGAECSGYGFHRHRKVSVFVAWERPSKLCEAIRDKWNQMQFEEARFLYNENGNPFKHRENILEQEVRT